MKSSLKLLMAATLATASTGCSSFLDVNTNTNAFTTDTAPAPNAVLAQALNATATLYSTSYNSYASWAADYWAKSGVVSGYAEERTYSYTTSYYQALWSSTYDNLNDYNIIRQAASSYPNHAAIARIMMAYNYLLLVDEYGDVPYTQALKGTSNLTPTYDKAADIYKDLIVQLQGAIADINTASQNSNAPVVGTEDIVFAGSMSKWKQFANSLQLRILLRESQTNDAALNAYVATQMTALQTAADGFITTDVQANPGYAQSSGQQNPFYNRYGVTYTGTSSSAERFFQFPTADIIAKYLNNPNPGTLVPYNSVTSDPRITVLYTTGKKGTVTAYNGAVAGEANPPGTAAPNIGSRFSLGSTTVAAGILKGYNAPTPLMLVSEHYFNKSEAETRGLFTNSGAGGNSAAKLDYIRGMVASFMYFFRPAGTAPSVVPAITNTLAASTIPGVPQYAAYRANATANANVNWNMAPDSTSALGKQSIILYQKYLAMNTVASTEAWDDYRRAAKPSIPFSVQAAQNKFPKRLLYPLSEVNTNQTNIPKSVDQYTAIFWDVVD